jgi:transposase-like protein
MLDRPHGISVMPCHVPENFYTAISISDLLAECHSNYYCPVPAHNDTYHRNIPHTNNAVIPRYQCKIRKRSFLTPLQFRQTEVTEIATRPAWFASFPSKLSKQMIEFQDTWHEHHIVPLADIQTRNILSPAASNNKTSARKLVKPRCQKCYKSRNDVW